MTEQEIIEEMARLMCGNFDTERGMCCEGTECDHDCWAYREATYLHNSGYRKERQGKWITTLKGQMDRINVYIHKCKNCGYVFENIRPYGSEYCQGCGAKMKGAE